MELFYAQTKNGTLPAATRVLVLAPHPDDEIFGCGGCLALYRSVGASVHVHILTDGAGLSQPEERVAIRQRRFAESDAALSLLDIPPASHANLPDRGLAGHPSLSDDIAQLIEQHRPDVIFAPSTWEIHPDHLATARATLLAAQSHAKTERWPLTVLLYEIGSPLRAELLIDVTPVWEVKEKAMRAFISQLSQQDYLRHITALNTYRTYTLPASISHAEALIPITHDQLLTQSADCLAHDPEKHALRNALIKADAESEQQLAALAVLQRAENEARAALHLARNEITYLRQMQADLLNSTSWQITAPLRWLIRHFRRR